MSQQLSQWRSAQMGLHGPLTLSLNQQFQLIESIGDVGSFGFAFDAGQDVRDTLPVLYGYDIEDSYALNNVSLPQGQVVDILAESHQDGAYLLLRDARQRHDAVQETQQQRNEVELLRRRLAKGLKIVEEANQAKSRFIASMSHEFRTPLTSIQGYARRCVQLADGELAENAGAILRSSEYLLTLVENLLDQGRLDATEVVIQTEAAQPAELLDLLREIFSPLCVQRGLSLYISCAGDVPQWLLLDITRMRQIAVNLLGNACKFTQRGEIRCVLSYSQEHVLLSVSDSGPGIAPEHQERIFAAFERIDESAPGVGLGLAISRQIARRMGGDLTLESTLGQGCCFRLRVPAKICDGPALARRAAREVVLVEDDHMIARLLTLLLTDAGHSVTHFANGAEAASYFEKNQADCLVTDMKLPGLSGVELIGRVRQQYPHCRIVTLSASVSASDRARALEAGADVYESKPIQQQRLLAAISGEG